MAQRIQIKRGRKTNRLAGVTDNSVKTWALFNNEWVYQGLCRQHTICESDGQYNYSSVSGIRIKQEK